jgi:1-acyl-sn-glycerol-3-phosphate acyltransferase
VVPCGLVGTDRIQPTGYRLPKKIMRVQVRFGAPLRFPKDADLRVVTDEVVAAIQALSGQDYVDIYAASLKKG